MICVSTAFGQSGTSLAEKHLIEDAGDQWWYTMVLIFICGLGFAIYFWKKNKKGSVHTESVNLDGNYYSDLC